MCCLSYWKIKYHKKRLDKRCRFRDICPNYQDDSFTCNQRTDRNYCGKWRYYMTLVKEGGL